MSHLEQLSVLLGRHQVVVAFSMNDYEQTESRGVMAGLLDASKELLTPPEFSRLIAACEIDPVTLSDLLALATADPNPSDPSDSSDLSDSSDSSITIN